MADTKISALPAKAVPTALDVTNILDSVAANADKKITLGDLPLAGNRELKALATGFLKNTTGSGALSIAAPGTDYVVPGGALGTPSSGTLTNCTGLPIAGGGTGQATAQAAIDALTAVSGATNEHVLTKDTATGNAKFKAAAAGSTLVLTTAPGEHASSGLTVSMTAGASLARGNVCYIGSDGKLELCDADAAATMPAFAMVVDATIAENAAGNVLLYGVYQDASWSWATVGALVYPGTTPGEIVIAAPSGVGDQVQPVGWVIAATKIFFLPYPLLVEVGTGIATPAEGGTGIANNAASTLTITGAYATTVTVTGATGVTLPTSGTLLASGGALGTPSSGTLTNCTGLPIAGGGTGQTTAQAAINALTAVSGATAEHVLTKDTATGNAIFKVAAAASSGTVWSFGMASPN